MPIFRSRKWFGKLSAVALKSRYQKNLAVFQELGTFPLPDLSQVKLPSGCCSCMTPQGICATKEYILITAYCNVKRFQKDLKASKRKEDQQMYQKVRQEPVHHSCIFVYAKEDHRYLTVLELPDRNHVGGIAYDGKYIWIAKSTEQVLSVIREKALHKAVQRALLLKNGTISYLQKDVPCGMTASFLTFHDGKLWVGFCASAGNRGALQAFRVQEKSLVSLLPVEKVSIPAKANGASFTGDDLFLNLSGGRRTPSQMILYHVRPAGPAKQKGIRLKKERTVSPLPPLLEESCIDEGVFYTVYESSSPAYQDVKGNCCDLPVGVVCMTSPDFLKKGDS